MAAAPSRPDRPDPASGLVPMTLEEFLEWEEEQELRYEFDGTYVVAMTGSTVRHSLIAGNIYAALRGPARRAGCSAHQSDVQVRTASGRVYFPDVVVRCGPFAMGERHARTPCLVVEVTSPSTRAVDYGRKREDYCATPSVQGYLVVEQGARRVECHVRLPDGAWTHVEMSDAGNGTVRFAPPCVDAVLTLDEVYEGTDIPAPPADLAGGGG